MPEETQPEAAPGGKYNGSQSQSHSQPGSPSSASTQAILAGMRFQLDQQTRLEKTLDEKAALALQPQIVAAEKELHAKNRELITLLSQYQLLANRWGIHSPDAWQAFRQIYAAGYELALPLAQTLPGARRYSGLAEQLAKKSLLLVRWSILYSYYDKIIWNFSSLVRYWVECICRERQKGIVVLDEWAWEGEFPSGVDPEAISIEELQHFEEAGHAKEQAQAYAHSEEDYWQRQLRLAEALTKRGDKSLDEVLQSVPGLFSFHHLGGHASNKYTLPLSRFGISSSSSRAAATDAAGTGENMSRKAEFEVDAYTLVRLATPVFAEHYRVSRVAPTAHLMLNLVVQVAVSELPTEQKEVLLDQAKGYSLQKIAGRRGWTSKLTYLHLLRGRQSLKLKLEEELSFYMTIIDVERQAVTRG